jgi:hypothetical protein
MKVTARFLAMCTMVLVVASEARAQTTKPATTQAVTEPLVGGALRYAPPAGWALDGEKSDKLVRYRLGEKTGFLEIAVDALPVAVGPTEAGQMAMQVGKAIREQAKNEGSELLYGPRAEKDERFWLVLHDRMKLKTGETMDRKQMLRVFGVYVVRIAATGLTDSQEEAKKIHQVGEEILDKMRIARGVKPTFYPKTQIKITPPVDWKELKSDQPNGLVSTLTDARKATSKMIVRARILPKDARTDTAKRDALVEKMVDDERQTTPYSKTAKSDGDKASADSKFLKRVVGTAVESGKPVAVQTRYFVIGDVIVSVRAVAEEADAAAVNELADRLSIAPIRE